METFFPTKLHDFTFGISAVAMTMTIHGHDYQFDIFRSLSDGMNEDKRE